MSLSALFRHGRVDQLGSRLECVLRLGAVPRSKNHIYSAEMSRAETALAEFSLAPENMRRRP
jgi:hypothetical protein